MKELFDAAFADLYRGRHLPADALWWWMHPDLTGPSGAEPPQRLFQRATAELLARGHDGAAAAMDELAGTLGEADRSAVLGAIRDIIAGLQS